jgi:hypothetical protein
MVPGVENGPGEIRMVNHLGEIEASDKTPDGEEYE